MGSVLSTLSDIRESEYLDWTGQRGRQYRRSEEEIRLEQRDWIEYTVEARGDSVGQSQVAEGANCSLRVYKNSDDENGLQRFRREAVALVALSRHVQPPISPAIFDHVGSSEQPGLVLEWCPTTLDSWWSGMSLQSGAVGELLTVMAAVVRKCALFRGFCDNNPNHGDLVADIRPQTILRSVDGVWLLNSVGSSSNPFVSANFASPEELFQCSDIASHARDSWALGLTFLSLLAGRECRLNGHGEHKGSEASSEPSSYRVQLVRDLFERKPALFKGARIDARQFLYPENLPERDLRLVGQALQGCLGSVSRGEQEKFVVIIKEMLDRCLSIDPRQRYLDLDELAGDFDKAAVTYYQLVAGAHESAEPHDVSEHIVTTPKTTVANSVGAKDDKVVKIPTRAAMLNESVTPSLLNTSSVNIGQNSGEFANLQKQVGRLQARLREIEVTQQLHERGMSTVQTSSTTKPTPVNKWLTIAVAGLLVVEVSRLVLGAGGGDTPNNTRNLSDVGNDSVLVLQEQPDLEEKGAELRSEVLPATKREAAALQSGATLDNTVLTRQNTAATPDREVGLVLLIGREGYLVGESGEVATGVVSVGEYKLYTKYEGNFVAGQSFTVESGSENVFSCVGLECKINSQ